jgi:predicted TIM-barrel fold metal-dependent hydrolase
MSGAQDHLTVVDAHVHCLAGSVGLLVRAMDLAGIDGAVILAAPGQGEQVLEEALGVDSRRLRVLVSPDVSLAATPAWGAELDAMDRLLEHAAGIKLYKNLSFGERRPSGASITFLSPELDDLWAIAAARARPVLLHCADPADFWRRRPRLRARQLEAMPERRYRDAADVRSRKELIAARDELFRRHPTVRFVGAHLGGFPSTPAELARFLRHGPVDTSAALEEVITFDRCRVEPLLRRHEHDILWGSDLVVHEPLPGCESALVKLGAKFLADTLRMATAAEAVHAPSTECPWRAPGLGLSGELRESVLGRNAIRLYWGASN